VAARLTKASETTLRGRRTEWLVAGVFDKLLAEAIAAYDRIIGLDLRDIAVDGSLHKAHCGGTQLQTPTRTSSRMTHTHTGRAKNCVRF
jgi:hypothetical protein